MNLLQIRTKLRLKLDETSEGFWLDDELDGYINESYFELWQLMLEVNFNGCLTSTFKDIVASTETIALPTDFHSARLIEKVVDSGTVPLWWDERFERANYTAGVAVNNGYQPSIRFVGQNLILEPTPAESQTGGIKITYYFYPDRLDDDADEPHIALHDFWHDLITYGATLIAKAKEEAIGGGGADLGAWGAMMERKQARFKNSIEVPSVSRQAVEPFELGDF